MQSGRAFFAFARFTILGGLSKKIKPKLNPARKICTWLFHDALKYKMSLLLAFNYSQRCTTHTFLQPLFFKTSKYPGSAKTDLAFYSQPMFQTIQRNHDSEESYWKKCLISWANDCDCWCDRWFMADLDPLWCATTCWAQQKPNDSRSQVSFFSARFSVLKMQVDSWLISGFYRWERVLPFI